MPLWVSGYRQAEIAAAKRLVDRNRAELDAQARECEGAFDEIKTDQAFLSFLSDHAVVEAAALEEPNPFGMSSN